MREQSSTKKINKKNTNFMPPNSPKTQMERKEQILEKKIIICVAKPRLIICAQTLKKIYEKLK